MTNAVPQVGFLRLIGLDTMERGEGLSRNRLTVGPDHMNPHGVCHGGVVYSLADTGMGGAVTTTLAAGESCTTIEIKIVYIAAVREGVLECETKVVHKGRTTAVLESELTQNGRLVAKALGTFAILQPRTA